MGDVDAYPGAPDLSRPGVAARAASGQPPLAPVGRTPGSPFDLKAAITKARVRGGIRGSALPLLLDLARKPFFLHDDSVSSLDNLLDRERGPNAPHPFYLDGKDRSDMVEFLRGLDANGAQK